MVMVTHFKGEIWAGGNPLPFWDFPLGRQTGLDYGLSKMKKKKQKEGTLEKYHNEFNLIDEKLCQWKDSS